MFVFPEDKADEFDLFTCLFLSVAIVTFNKLSFM